MLFLASALFAQISDTDLRLEKSQKKVVDGITSVAEMLISDSFSPMSRYETGDFRGTVSASLFDIVGLHDERRVKTNKIRGWTLGGGGGYALTDRWLVYGILAGMSVEGEVEMDSYEAVDRRGKADTAYSLISLHGGLGYQMVNTSWVSVPLFLGPQIQYYGFDIIPETQSTTIGATTAEFSSEIAGNGLLYGVSGGAAASFSIFGRAVITPYVLGLAVLNKADYEGEVTATTSLPSERFSRTEEFSVGPIYATMFGLDVGYNDPGGWGVSFALGDLIAYMTGYGNSLSSGGVEMRPLILIVTYSR
jgi:hypothetical protein